MIFSLGTATSEGTEGRWFGKLLVPSKEDTLEVLKSFVKKDLGFINGFSKKHFVALVCNCRLLYSQGLQEQTQLSSPDVASNIQIIKFVKANW